jgi:hypothetical protein
MNQPKHPNIKTKVVHSQSKSAWNVIGMSLGAKHKIAIIPYLVTGDKVTDEKEKSEALEHAEFISFCFNT